MVIREGKIANYQPYPPTPWNASPRDTYGTPGPYEDAVQNTPIFEENGPENFKGVDIMRAVRSFDPCLPCGVHMYTGAGKVRKVMHTPTGLSVVAEVAEPERLLERVQELSEAVDELPDPRARELASELVSAVIAMYGDGLERILAAISEAGEPGAAILDRLTAGRRGLQPAADPRPVPGRPARARARGAGHGPALHGVPRRQRRAGRR